MSDLQTYHRYTIKDWEVVFAVDVDGHLTFELSHKDGSKVIECGADCACDEYSWADRFTTKKIEADYLEREAMESNGTDGL
jgi:hypothetical protein